MDLALSSARAVLTFSFQPAMSGDEPVDTLVPFGFRLNPADAQKVEPF